MKISVIFNFFNKFNGLVEMNKKVNEYLDAKESIFNFISAIKMKY